MTSGMNDAPRTTLAERVLAGDPRAVARAISSSSISEIARATARGSPASTRSARVVRGASFIPDVIRIDVRDSSRQELTRDHETLDLARAFADRRQLDVAEIFLDWI